MTNNKTNIAPSPGPDADKKFLVVAADMAHYNGHEIKNYHLVMTRAVDEESALKTATSALEDGFLPLVGFTVDDLRQLADELTGRALEPQQSYNVSAGMMDHEFAEPGAHAP